MGEITDQELRDLIEVCGLSITRISQISGVGRSAICDIMAGRTRPRPETKAKIATAIRAHLWRALLEASREASK